MNVSRGYLAKLIAKVSRSLAAAYGELFDRLPSEASLNVDETGHTENREKYWTWCFRAPLYTLFHIDKSRGSQVLVEVLGTEFNGVLGCDYFSAYRKYMREVRRAGAVLLGPPDPRREVPADAARQERIRLTASGCGEALRELFAVIHRRETMTAAGFQQALEAARKRVLCGGHEPACRTRNMPATWPNAFANMGERTSASSPRRASSRPTTWPNRRFASW